jgi:arylsulfatase A-like enzyme
MKLAVVLVALGTALTLGGCGGPHRPDIVLITVDTLRADHLGAYAQGASTPRLDALARDATVFERCSAPMPLTRPSHFSLLTSLYPREHGVLNNAIALPEDAESVAEVFAAAGYRTGGFVAVKLLGPESGAAQGFGHFDEPVGQRERPTEGVVQSALGWLDGLRRDERFFLWLHLFDPHLPYAPPASFRGGLAPERPELNWERLTELAAQNGGDVPASALAEGKALYRGEVSYVDHFLGEFLDGLAARRDLDETLIVFTADHGECFENGIYFEHADCLWEGGIHVPLIVRYPPLVPAGQRIPEQTSLVDIAPTLLAAAGLETPSRVSGRALQDHASFGDRVVLVQYPFFQPSAADRRPERLEIVRSVAGDPTTPILLQVDKVGLVGTDWKYLRGGDREELYALTPDVDERTDCGAAQPEVLSRLRAELARQLEHHRLHLIDAPEINEELLQMLRALGYL